MNMWTNSAGQATSLPMATNPKYPYSAAQVFSSPQHGALHVLSSPETTFSQRSSPRTQLGTTQKSPNKELAGRDVRSDVMRDVTPGGRDIPRERDVTPGRRAGSSTRERTVFDGSGSTESQQRRCARFLTAILTSDWTSTPRLRLVPQPPPCRIRLYLCLLPVPCSWLFPSPGPPSLPPPLSPPGLCHAIQCRALGGVEGGG